MAGDAILHCVCDDYFCSLNGTVLNLVLVGFQPDFLHAACANCRTPVTGDACFAEGHNGPGLREH